MLVAAEDLSNVSVVWTAVGDDEPDFAMMIAICGTVGGASGAEALDAMLAALADCGPERATWTEGGIGLGSRGARQARSPTRPAAPRIRSPLTTAPALWWPRMPVSTTAMRSAFPFPNAPASPLRS